MVVIRVLAVAGLAAVLLSPPQVAFAAGALTDRAVSTSTTDGTERWDYAVRNSFRYSVVGVKPASGSDYDLAVSDQNGTWLQSSWRGSNLVDFVVLRTGFEPDFFPGTYHADVSHFAGTGSYSIEFFEESATGGPVASGVYLMDSVAPIGTMREANLPISTGQFIVVTGMGFVAGWSYRISCRSTTSIFQPFGAPGEMFVVGGRTGGAFTSVASGSWPVLSSSTVTVVGTDEESGQSKFALVVASTRTVHCAVTNLGPL
jgi:hypothetical protein